MVTPGGAECTYYYEDFQRGSERQECRAPKDPSSAGWRPTDCARCPVPAILAANGSPHLQLRIKIGPGLLHIGRRVEVEARCALHGATVGDPIVGCGVCNAEADDLLKRALD